MSAPPSADDDDATLLQIYRQSSCEDAQGQINEASRAAILAEAQRSFAARRAHRRWSIPVWAAAAAAVVAVLMAIPQLRQLGPVSTPQAAAVPGVTGSALSATAPPVTPAVAPPVIPPAEQLTGAARRRSSMSRPRAPAALAPQPTDQAVQESVVTEVAKRANEQSALQSSAAATVQRAVPSSQAPTPDSGTGPNASADLALLRANRLASPPAASFFTARDALGRTALIEATIRGDLQRVRALLAEGAEPNQADAQGRTALQWARTEHREQIAAALTAAGAHD